MISTRRFGYCEDGHGAGEFLNWAYLLSVRIWSRQRECQCFLMRGDEQKRLRLILRGELGDGCVVSLRLILRRYRYCCCPVCG